MGSHCKESEEKPSPLLSVEIGRLVYTYLGQTNCPRTQSLYKTENADLKELSLLVDKKLLRNIDLDLNGYNLEAVLKEYILIKFGIDRLCKSFLPDSGLLLNSCGPIQKLKCLSDYFSELTKSGPTASHLSVVDRVGLGAKTSAQTAHERKSSSEEMKELAKLKSRRVMSKCKTAVVPKNSKNISSQEIMASTIIPDLLKVQQPIPPTTLELQKESRSAPEHVINMIRAGNDVMLGNIETSNRPPVFHIRKNLPSTGSHANQAKLSTDLKSTRDKGLKILLPQPGQTPIIALGSKANTGLDASQSKRRSGRSCKSSKPKSKTAATESAHNLSAAQALLTLSKSDPNITFQDNEAATAVQTASTTAGVLIASGASPHKDSNFQSCTSTPKKTPEKTGPPQDTEFMETSSILPTDTPSKSRKRCLKSKPPVKNKSLSMPIFFFEEKSSDVRKKIEAFTQGSSDDVMSNLIAEPLATLFTETGNVNLTVSNFLSNSELFASFNQVLDDFTAHEKSTSLSLSENDKVPTTVACSSKSLSKEEAENKVVECKSQTLVSSKDDAAAGVQIAETDTAKKSELSDNMKNVQTRRSTRNKAANGFQPTAISSKKSKPTTKTASATKKRTKKSLKILNIPKRSQFIAGLSISYNSILNAEINDLMLVNHLDNIGSKSTLQLVHEFLEADIKTLPSAEVAVDQYVATEMASQNVNVCSDVTGDSKIEHDVAVIYLGEEQQEPTDLSGPKFNKLSPIKVPQVDKSSHSFSPNFSARKLSASGSKPECGSRPIDQTLMTPNMSKDCSLSFHTSDLPTSFINVLDKTTVSQQKKQQHRDASTFAKVLQKSANFAKVLESPVKTASPSKATAELIVDVTPPSVLQHDEESLITPPSECYENPEDQSPAKRGSRVSRRTSISTPVKASPQPTTFKNILLESDSKEPKIVGDTPSKRYPPISLSGATPFAPIAEEDSLITPPSERYANKSCAAEADPNTGNTPLKKRNCEQMDELCTPLKALREAVRLATPSPVKHHFPQKKNVPTTPGKWFKGLSSQQQVMKTPLKHIAAEQVFTPSPCRRPPTTPAKWYTPPYGKPTPLKGLDEALSKMAQCSPKGYQTPEQTCSSTPSKSFGTTQQSLDGGSQSAFGVCQQILGTPSKQHIFSTPSKSFGVSQRSLSPPKPVSAASSCSTPSKTEPQPKTSSKQNPLAVFVTASPSKTQVTPQKTAAALQKHTAVLTTDKQMHLTTQSPVKRVAEVAKKLFEGGAIKSRNYVFISPSKRIPRRAPLVKLAERSEKLGPGGLCSLWEANHDVNNLDNYRTIHEPSLSASATLPKASKPNVVVRSSPRKRKHTMPTESDNSNVKKPRKSQEAIHPSKVKVDLGKTKLGTTRKDNVKSPQKKSLDLDVNREIVPQLASFGKAPTAAAKSVDEKWKKDEKQTEDTGQMSLPVALGLMPKSGRLTKISAEENLSGKSCSSKSVQIANRFGLTMSKMTMYFVQDGTKKSLRR